MATAPPWGSVGVWLSRLALVGAEEAGLAVRGIEELGYGSLWVGETSVSKEVLTHAGLLLAASRRIVVATGIASIWARDPAAMHAAAVTLGEAYPGRFVLGLGVSHRDLVAQRGHVYERPLSAMRSYLDDMDRSRCDAPTGPSPVPVLLAALGPKMMRLASERTAGAHTYFMPVAHTRQARLQLGEGPLLIPEQAVIIEEDPALARSRAREHMAFYLGQPNYVRQLLAQGFDEGDVREGGSDTLVDALIAWGDAGTVAARVREHVGAGADHVAVQPLAPTLAAALEQLGTLAGALDGELAPWRT